MSDRHDRQKSVQSGGVDGDTGMFTPISPEQLGLRPPDGGRPADLSEGSAFLPVRRVPARHEDAALEVRYLNDGSSALLAYTSVRRLVEGMGPAQPWVELPPPLSVDDLQVSIGVDVVLWDSALPRRLRRHDEED